MTLARGLIRLGGSFFPNAASGPKGPLKEDWEKKADAFTKDTWGTPTHTSVPERLARGGP